jgi:protein ImuA
MLVLDARPADRPLALAPGVALARPRAHEVAGPARQLFAALVGAATEGTILWLAPRWLPERLSGDGLRPVVEPSRLVIGRCRGAVDILWATEEALRGGSVPLVVAELPAPPALTPVRRLHLAAEAGAAVGPCPPLALLLTPGEGGASGVESRWHLAPRPGWAEDGEARWRLSRTRARGLPPQAWDMRLDGARPRLVWLANGESGSGTLAGTASTPTGVAFAETVPTAR